MRPVLLRRSQTATGAITVIGLFVKPLEGEIARRSGDVNVYRVECQAVMVRDAGEGFFEDEVKMTRLKSRPYEKLLRQVEKRLGPSS